MSLELSTLSFRVETGQIKEAVTDLNNLVVALKGVNAAGSSASGLDKLGKGASEAGSGLTQASEGAEKLNKPLKELPANVDKASKFVKDLSNRFNDLVDGFSRGEASQLKQARSLGIVGEEFEKVKNILKDTSSLFKDPFDATVGSIRSVTAEFDKLTARMSLNAQGFSLTTSQLEQYSRISTEVAGKIKQLGMDPKSGEGLARYNALLKETQADYLMVAASVNQTIAAEKQRNDILRQQEKVQRDNLSMMDSAVAQFRKLEEEKAAAAQRSAKKIVDANQDAINSAERLLQISKLMQDGMSQGEATKRVDLAGTGVELANIERLIAAEKELANAKNLVSGASAKQSSAMSDSAKAAAWLEKELARAEHAVKDLSNELRVSTSNRLFRFEEMLKKSGLGAEETESMMNKYRAAVIQGQKKTNDDMSKELRNLSRSVATQMGDVAVSLAGGMNPFLVMIQQGDQLRYAFQQVEASSNSVQNAMRSAAGMIVSSFVDVGKAMGSFVIGSLQEAGSAIMGLVTGPYKAWRESLYGVNQQLTVMNRLQISAGALGNSFLAAIPTIATAAAIALTVLGVAYYKVLNSERELSKALIISGGQFGLNKESAIKYAQSMTGVGESTTEVVKALSSVVSAGTIADGSLGIVTRSVINLEKYLGVAADKTVAFFTKISESPTEALSKLAKETGKVDLAVLALVTSLEAQGKRAEAAALATKAAADAHSAMAKQAIADMDPLQKLWLDMKHTIAEAGQAVYSFIKDSGTIKVVTAAWETLVKIVAQVGVLIGLMVVSVKTLAEYATSGLSKYPEIFKRSADEIKGVLQGYSKLVGNLKEGAELSMEAAGATDGQAIAQGKLASAIVDTLEYQKKQTEESSKYSLEIIKAKKNYELLLAESKRLVSTEGNSQNAQSMVDRANIALKEVNRLEKLANDELVKLIADGEKEILEGMKKRAAEAEKIRNIENRMILQMTKVLNAQTKEQEKLTVSQKTYMDLVASEDYNKIGATAKARIKNIFDQAHAKEELNEQIVRNQKEVERLSKLQFEADKATGLLWEKTNALNDAMMTENEELIFQTTLLGMNTEAQKKAIAVRKSDLQLRKEIAEIDKSSASDSERADARLEAEKRHANRVMNINKEIALENTKNFISEMDKVKDGLADAIVTGLFEGGKAGKKKLRDLLVAELRKPITVIVRAMIDSVTGGFTNSFLGGATGNAAGGGAGSMLGSAAGSALGSITLGGSTLGAIGGSLGTGISAGLSGTSLQGAIAAYEAAGMTGVSTGLAAGQALGAALPWIGAAMALYSIYKSLDDSGTPHTGASASYSAGAGSKTGMGLYGVGSNQGYYSTDVETTMAAMSKGIVDLLDQTALSFGKTAGYEAAVAFADDSSKDGAWGSLAISKLGQELAGFGKDGNGRWPGKSFSDGEAGIKEFNNAVAADVRSALESIGLPEWASKMLKDIGDAPSMEKLGEVIGKINATQKAIESLGRVMPMFANLTSESMSSLLSAFGSVENLSSTAAGYYSNFFDDNEKAKAATEALSNEFKKLNVAVPTDRLAYRVEVEKALAAGNEELAAKLMMLSGAFAELNPWAESTGRTAQDIAANLAEMKKEGTELSIQLMTLQGKTAEANAAARLLAIEGLSELEIAAYDSNQVIRAQIAELTTKQDLDKQILELEGKKDILRQMELDKLSPANQELQKYIWSLQEAATAADKAAAANDALIAQRTKLSDQLFQLQSSEYDKQQKILADLKDSQSAAIQQQIWDVEAKQKKEAEAADKKKQLEQSAYDLETQKLQLLGDTKTLRERELALLDPSLKAAKLEIWAIQDKIEADKIAAQAAEEAARAQQQAAEEAARAAQQIKDAWKSITDSIFEEVARIRGLVTGSGSNSLAQSQANFDSASSRALAGDQEAAKSLPELSRVLLEVAGEQARSLVDLRRIQMLTAANLESVGTRINGMYGIPIPAYADGGNYAGGIALVGEQGPELINFNSGGRVYDARTSAAMMGNSNLEALVEKLNANIEGLRYEVRANVTHTSKVAKILERVSPEGDAIVVKFDTAQPVNVV